MLDQDDMIAIVGLAARVPGAADIEQLWSNLVAGHEAVTAVPAAVLAESGVPAERQAGPDYVSAASVAPDLERFDAAFFRMTPREAQLTDPQIRLFLEVAHSALENAGYDVTALDGRVGVFASCGSSDYAEYHLHPRDDLMEHASQGVNALNRADYVATTTSYRLNLRGPSLTVLTACSSTLVALHLACRSLQTGECDRAVVGGADIDFPIGHGYLWSPGGVRSRDGHCRPFDKDATGTIFGSGSAAVVLRRLGDAQAAGDHVTSVIRATAMNNDGADKVSFGAPSRSGQISVITEAIELAGIGPGDVSYVEMHGTGTIVGDPIEVEALAQAYARLSDKPLEPASCGIGSIKSNIGHLGSVAGIIGLVKAALSLDRELLPPSINFAAPNPKLDLGSTPFFVNDIARPWPRDDARPRRAGVSALGVGGTNVHVILEEPPAHGYAPDDGEPRLLLWSGLTEAARDAAGERLRAFLDVGCGSFPDVAGTLQHGRTHHAVRGALVSTDAAGAARALAAGRTFAGARPADGSPPIVMIFPGQGAQAVGMAAGLHGHVRSFTREFDSCCEHFAEAGLHLRDVWRGVAGAGSIDDTRFAQPLIFCVEYALAAMWQEAGIRPAAVIGHSIGELVAATVAGVFELSAAVSMAACRALAMQDAPPGGMLAVAADEAAVAAMLPSGLAIAAVNGDRQILVSGQADVLEEWTQVVGARGIATVKLGSTRAFHHPMLGDAAARVRQEIGDYQLRPPAVPLYSGATGCRLTADEAIDPEFWAGQIVTPVRFSDAIDAVIGDLPKALFLEVGPGRILSTLLRRHPAVRAGGAAAVACAPTLAGDPAADKSALLSAAAQVWVGGGDVSWSAFGQPEPTHRVAVPGYPYQRQRLWVDRPGTATGQASAAGPAGAAAAKESMNAGLAADGAEDDPAISPFSVRAWIEEDSAAGAERSGRTAVVLLPDDGQASAAVCRALHTCGLRIVRIRTGDAFAAEEDFTVRAGVADDFERVFDQLAARGVRPDLLVHALAACPWQPASVDVLPDQMARSFHALLHLVQRGLRAGAGPRLPEVVVLATGSTDVSGADQVHPLKATLHGFVRSLAKETPGLACRLIDYSANTPSDALSAELRRPAHDDVVVGLRGARRWVPTERALTVRPGQTVIRPAGVYVLTGGLGGIGLELGKALAATGMCPNLALVGRSAPAQESDLGAAAATAVRTMRDQGAQVRLIACDVADTRQLRRAFDLVAGVFGPVNGVFQLAGIAGDGMLLMRGQTQAAEVLRPKIDGTVGLAEVLAGRSGLDFVALISSRASVEGLIGSGDYAAANAVLDAAASAGWFPGRVLSIGFPSWSRVGMAARAAAASDQADRPDGDLTWTTLVSQELTWALDEHRLAGVPLLPGTAHIDLVLRAYRASAIAAGAPQPVLLSDVAFIAPLVATAPRTVTVMFEPDGARHRFKVLSRSDNDEAALPITHVTGWIESVARAEATVDLAALRGRMTALDLPDLDDPDRMFTLGPRWRTGAGLYADGAERLVDLRLPEVFQADLGQHVLHPALLDCATGSARDDHEPSYAPFIYRRMVVWSDLPAKISSHVRRRPAAAGLLVADIDVLAEDGRVLVAIEGFTMRRVDGNFAASAAAADREAAERVPTPAVADPVVDVGIPPALGCEMIFTLLAARTPGHVLVRPFLAGRPVPLPQPVTSADTGASTASAPAVVSSASAGSAPAELAQQQPSSQIRADRRESGQTLSRLRGLWISALGIAEIAADDDFFDLGGNSLSAVELMSRIREEFGMELSIGLLFDGPTLSQLAKLIDQAG